MSLLSGSLTEREEVLKAFFLTQGIDHKEADRLSQNLNAKLLTPLLDEGEWSLMYNDSELFEMIERGVFPLVDQLRQESYSQGYQDAQPIDPIWDELSPEEYGSY